MVHGILAATFMGDAIAPAICLANSREYNVKGTMWSASQVLASAVLAKLLVAETDEMSTSLPNYVRRALLYDPQNLPFQEILA